jgi:hypothetical protein
MASMVVGDLTLESLTPSVNAPLLLYYNLHCKKGGGGP